MWQVDVETDSEGLDQVKKDGTTLGGSSTVAVRMQLSEGTRAVLTVHRRKLSKHCSGHTEHQRRNSCSSTPSQLELE